MKKLLHYIFVLVMLGSVPACALIDANDESLDEDVYEGVFAQGFEDSPFEPCGRDERWLIVFGDEAVGRAFSRRISEVVGTANPMYVRLRGEPSAKGQFPGIFITYDREFTLNEVLDVRPPRSGDCR